MDQRFYASSYGRFNTPDLVGGGAKEPGSWNMYSYTRGDPVNRTDHSGLCDSDFCVDAWGSSWSWGDPLAGLWVMAGPDFNPSALAECLTVPGCEDAYQLSKGGGGGYPEGAAGVVTASNLSRSGVNEAKIERVMTDLEDNIDPDCASWLLGNPVFKGTTIQSMTQDAINNGSVGHGVLTNANPNLMTNAVTNLPNNLNLAIIINDNGAFFHSGMTTDNGNISGGTGLAQVFILLHEYAHLLQVPGFLDDATSTDNGIANNNMVQANCAKTLAEFK